MKAVIYKIITWTAGVVAGAILAVNIETALNASGGNALLLNGLPWLAATATHPIATHGAVAILAVLSFIAVSRLVGTNRAAALATRRREATQLARMMHSLLNSSENASQGFRARDNWHVSLMPRFDAMWVKAKRFGLTVPGIGEPIDDFTKAIGACSFMREVVPMLDAGEFDAAVETSSAKSKDIETNLYKL